jgi:alkanesulfonate monooxygenase SsuD/methylene tetrahydromethanopterin reductase-like flavin-dependent oxidoreductase (luciferase family)
MRIACNLLENKSRRELDQYLEFVEACGFDGIYLPDHIGLPDPFQTLGYITAATELPTVGTLMINAAAWNPAHLLRSAVTAIGLAGERLALGLGAGYGDDELRALGVDKTTLTDRIAHLRSMIAKIREESRAHFESVTTRILAGGIGDLSLQLAGELADVVSLTGTFERRDVPQSRSWPCTLEETQERLSIVDEAARLRTGIRPEVSILTQVESVPIDKISFVSHLRSERGRTRSVLEVLETPFFLIGSPLEIAERLAWLESELGVNEVVIHEPFVKEFAGVLSVLGRQRA